MYTVCWAEYQINLILIVLKLKYSLNLFLNIVISKNKFNEDNYGTLNENIHKFSRRWSQKTVNNQNYCLKGYNTALAIYPK